MYDLTVQKQKMYCIIGPIEYIHISLKNTLIYNHPTVIVKNTLDTQNNPQIRITT